MMFRTIAAVAGCAWAVAVTQAAEVDVTQPVKSVEQRTPIHADSGPAPKSFKFALWRSLVMPSDQIGGLSQSMFCGSARPIFYEKSFSSVIETSILRAFRDESAKAGYTQADRSESVFDQKTGTGADFRIGATLLELDYRYCGSTAGKGSAYAKIKWEVYSERHQRVIYSAEVPASVIALDSQLKYVDFRDRFGNAVVDNLLGDPKFAEAVRTDGEGGDAVPALAAMAMQVGHAANGPMNSNATAVLAAVVTLESGVGSGSGFFIGRDGYLLTNQHVVSSARFVKVKLSDGRSMVGEVLRTDAARDVALVKTDPVSFDVLALRTTEGRVGEDVYALGSPLGGTFSSTLTKGVLSARRVMEGVAYLQSDAAVNPGNSGGPLVDADGRVLGITRIGSDAHGLSLFIPIGEAIAKLSISAATDVAAHN